MEGWGRKQDLELSKNIPASSLILKVCSGVFYGSLFLSYRGMKSHWIGKIAHFLFLCG
jgi:hypothetical protein